MRRFLPLLLLAAALAGGGAWTFSARAATPQVTVVAEGLEHPWALAFLPEGEMLVTERSGRLRRIGREGQLSPPLAGVPTVVARGQGGLLDVVPAPDFARSRQIYLSYSEPRDGRRNGTTVMRARLGALGLEGQEILFRQEPAMDSGHHFGSRLAFAPDGRLFVTLGDRGNSRDQAQSLGGHLGKVVRLEADGRVPRDNPFLKTPGARPELWSYGHRNPQGAAIHPVTGQLWIHEHGPQGGDEVNLPRPGRNYGWPVVTHGREYSGAKLGEGKHKEGMETAVQVWVPSIAPSGMAFYTHARFPQWRDSLFVGSLKFGQLVQLRLDGERIAGEERYEIGRRVRDVRQGPDGALYLLTDESRAALLRVTPAAP